MPARIFVAVDARDRECVTPERRRIGKVARLDGVEHFRRNADIGDRDASAMGASGQQQMRRLLPEKGDRLVRAYGTPHHLPAAAVDAARHIDRNDACAARIDRLHHRRRRAFDRTIEAGAEQRIDHDVGARESAGRRGLGRALPGLRGFGRVTLQPIALAEQQHPHLQAALGKEPRRDETVASIVAWSRHHHDALAGRGGRAPHRRPRAPPPPSARNPLHRRRWSAGRPPPFRNWSAAQSSDTLERLQRIWSQKSGAAAFKRPAFQLRNLLNPCT